ncbi:subtilisin family serine protease [Actinokineospora baliensis]|uniref:S8 family serine peptidase n=1 Tax=Actinokineospora baliensis TaxID=547056 RepID=UPI0019591F17|nr:S8 family serine peptidase [Actinokineospora baliensis]MBM7774887.1 subtilisin family serine protease [Actinokineospora baliensis]
MRTTRWPRLAAVAAVVAGVVLSGTHLTHAAAAEPTLLGSRSVTLLTGDRVEVDALGHRTIHPGPNREKASFSYYEKDGHHFIVPVDALRSLADDRLDERLFDIDALLEAGYDGSDVPVIVTYRPGLAPVQPVGAAKLPAVNGFAVAARPDGAVWRSLDSPGVRKIWLDGVRKPQLDKSAAQIGAPVAWQAGYTGTGVKVAVLDSGIDKKHPDLATRVVQARTFSDAPDGLDRIGHGTHIASIIAGTGAKYRGIASGAQLLDGKVFDDSGSARDSWIIAGMQWAAESGAKVVNLSLAAPDQTDPDPLEDAVNTLSAQHGTLFVVSAGNSGPTGGTVGSPGSADAALTVGAVDRTDKILSFSSRGPRVGDGAVKPDITAPGMAIVAARSSDSPGDGPYVADFGTSMAAAHVSGAAAVLAQQHPDWSGERLKDVLMASAKPGAGQTIFQEGTGRVDVAAAIGQTLSSEPASVHLGIQKLPDNEGSAFSRTVTYRNTGVTESTLDLKTVLIAPDGKPVTMLTVSPARLTIPAGGTATATYTITPPTGAAQGIYGGVVLAGSMRTPVVFVRSEQTYEVKVRQIGLDGSPAIAGYARIVSKAAGARQYQVPATGRIRLPKGEYSVDALLVGDNLNWLFQPSLTVSGNMEVVVDYRLTKPLSIRPPARATSRFADVTLSYGDYQTGIAGTDITRTTTGTAGPRVPGDAVTTKVHTQWVADNGDFYGLAYFGRGGLPDGMVKRPSKRDLAHVRANLNTTTPGSIGARAAAPYPVVGEVLDSSPGYDVAALPRVRDEYYTTSSDGALWNSLLAQLSPAGVLEATSLSPLRAYRAGHDYTETFNRGVFGPVFPPLPKNQSFVSRAGDTVRAAMSLYGDANGNAGDVTLASRTTTLYRDGTKIGESTDLTGPAMFPVPAEAGKYQLVTEATRAPGVPLSTRITASWTFQSTHAETPAAIPVSTIRFTPRLDDNNSAAKGRLFVVPVSLQAQGSTATRPLSGAVDVSYDSGKTWQKAPVLGGAAILCHPPTAGTVSLRARTADRSVELTIIDAYTLH